MRAVQHGNGRSARQSTQAKAGPVPRTWTGVSQITFFSVVPGAPSSFWFSSSMFLYLDAKTPSAAYSECSRRVPEFESRPIL